MTLTSAPGKFILLGEHAVVFGQPAIAVAINLRLRCRLELAERTTINGEEVSERQHAYILQALRTAGQDRNYEIVIDSDIPSGSGLGSSAAVSVAVLGALRHAQGGMDEESIAKNAFEVELAVQGRASPVDTSTSAHGQGIFLNSIAGDGILWSIAKSDKRWFVHHCPVPPMSIVVGFTGIRKPTGPQVAKVRRYVERSTFAKDIIQEIGQVTLEGREALRSRDLERLGRLMTTDHNLLAILGVSSPELQKLVDASLPYSYGAKLTGAGGGGSMIALTDEPHRVARAIASRGGTPFIVHTGVEGVRLEHHHS